MVLTLGLPCLLIYLSLGYAWRVFAFVFLLLFYFFPSPPIRSGEVFSSVIFFLSFSSFVFFLGCSDGMEREACVCDHGYERSDLCAEIIIVVYQSYSHLVVFVYFSLNLLYLCWLGTYFFSWLQQPGDENGLTSTCWCLCGTKNGEGTASQRLLLCCSISNASKLRRLNHETDRYSQGNLCIVPTALCRRLSKHLPVCSTKLIRYDSNDDVTKFRIARSKK